LRLHFRTKELNVSNVIKRIRSQKAYPEIGDFHHTLTRRHSYDRHFPPSTKHVGVLFYSTRCCLSKTADLLRYFKPTSLKSLTAVTHSYLYRENDLHSAGKGKPEWMVMYEMANNKDKPQPPVTIDKLSIDDPNIQIHRQGLYKLQASKSISSIQLSEFQQYAKPVSSCIPPIEPDLERGV
jgi:hypothetical protein